MRKISLIFVNIFVFIVLLVPVDLFILPNFIKNNYAKSFFKSYSFNVDIKKIKLSEIELISSLSHANFETKCLPSFRETNKEWCVDLKEYRLRKYSQNTIERKKVILLIGCSMIFGDQLYNDETLSSQLENFLPNYQIINLGISGGSIQQQLELVLSGYLDKYRDRELTVVYGGYDSHVRRANFGSTDCCLAWGQRFIEENGELLHQGVFNQTLLKELPLYYFSISTIFRTLFSDYQNKRKPSKKEFKNYKQQLITLKKLYKKISSNVKIISFSYHNRDTKFSSLLEDISDHYIDITSIIGNLKESDVYIPIDGHPTPYLNKLISKSLADHIEK